MGKETGDFYHRGTALKQKLPGESRGVFYHARSQASREVTPSENIQVMYQR